MSSKAKAKTYWRGDGELQRDIERLRKQIPDEGKCQQDRPKLDALRRWINIYYDVCNNGLCNLQGEFAEESGYERPKGDDEEAGMQALAKRLLEEGALDEVMTARIKDAVDEEKKLFGGPAKHEHIRGMAEPSPKPASEPKQIDDGGPAFPMPAHNGANGEQSYPIYGMTLRDWLAAQANENDIADAIFYAHKKSQLVITRQQARYVHADAMIAARKGAI